MKTNTAKKPKPQKSDEKKQKLCVENDCKAGAVSHGYCRLHYIAHWKHIKFNDKVKAERRLNAYVDRIAKKYPKDYLDKIREGLEDENRFKQLAEELDVEPEAAEKETDNEFLEKFLRTVKPGGE